jgi:hypothetical protein
MSPSCVQLCLIRLEFVGDLAQIDVITVARLVQDEADHHASMFMAFITVVVVGVLDPGAI